MNRRTIVTPLGFSGTWGEEKQDYDYKVSVPKYARELKWTTEPPTSDGLYFVWSAHWLPHVKEPAIAHINGDGISIDGDEWLISKSGITHWLGPLPIPAPPTESE